jgi:hypothetical protein
MPPALRDEEEVWREGGRERGSEGGREGESVSVVRTEDVEGLGKLEGGSTHIQG